MTRSISRKVNYEKKKIANHRGVTTEKMPGADEKECLYSDMRRKTSEGERARKLWERGGQNSAVGEAR